MAFLRWPRQSTSFAGALTIMTCGRPSASRWCAVSNMSRARVLSNKCQHVRAWQRTLEALGLQGTCTKLRAGTVYMHAQVHLRRTLAAFGRQGTCTKFSAGTVSGRFEQMLELARTSPRMSCIVLVSSASAAVVITIMVTCCKFKASTLSCVYNIANVLYIHVLTQKNKLVSTPVRTETLMRICAYIGHMGPCMLRCDWLIPILQTAVATLRSLSFL